MQTSQDGYLLHSQDWTENWALEKALELKVCLEDFDWQVIGFARRFYQEFQVMPLSRRLIKFIREALDQDFSSLQFQLRYSEKPLRVIALLAGLPKPVQCL